MSPEEVFQRLLDTGHHGSQIDGFSSPALSETSSEATNPSRKRGYSSGRDDDETFPKYLKLEHLNGDLMIDCKSDGESEDDKGGKATPSDLSLFLRGPVTDATVFCRIPSRLSMLHSVVKHDMTIGEIKRRVQGPEQLPLSTMSGLLRRAKGKGGLKDLREQLMSYGIVFPGKSYRSQFNSAFSSLTEGEAVQLAKEFDSISKNVFPVNTVAAEFNNRFKGEALSDAKQKRKIGLISAVSVLKELGAHLDLDRPPFQGANPEVLLPQQEQTEMNRYAALTHNFGTPALVAGINMAARILEHSLLLTSVEKIRSQDVPEQQNLQATFVQLLQLFQQNGGRNLSTA